MSTPLFITFEGMEGVGKSTQIKLLREYLQAQSVPVITTLEPGGTSFGRNLRELLLSPDTSLKNHLTEILLFFADRLEHIDRIIKPSLDTGHVILCDRFMDSTYAYQVGGRKLAQDWFDRLSTFVSLSPTITFLLDTSPEECLKRVAARGEMDRFEKEEIAFHYRVRDAYLDLASQQPDRIKHIDIKGLTPSQVFEKIQSYIDPLLNTRS